MGTVRSDLSELPAAPGEHAALTMLDLCALRADDAFVGALPTALPRNTSLISLSLHWQRCVIKAR